MPDPAQLEPGLRPEISDNGHSPEFRIWYSGNYGFEVDNGEAPASDKDSVFVNNPEIVEALELLAVRAGSAPAELPDEHKQLDMRLAMRGFAAIRGSKQVESDAPELRKTIIKTKKQIRAEEEERERASNSSNGSFDTVEAKKAAQEDKTRERAEAQEKHENERKETASKLFETFREQHPDVNLDDYISLYQKVTGRLKNGEGIEVRAGKGFNKLMGKLVEELALEPERLTDLSYASSLLGGINNESSNTRDIYTLNPYLDFLREQLWGQLELGEIDASNVPSEVLSRWFEIIDQAPLDFQRDMDGTRSLSRVEFDRIPADHIKGMIATRHFSRFILNDCVKTADKYSPVPLVDKIYRLAEHAFDSGIDYEGTNAEVRQRMNQSSRANRTLDLIGTIFNQRPVVGMILSSGAGSKLPMESRLKILDFKLFLHEFGADGVLLNAPGRASNGPIDLDEKAVRLVERIYPNKPAPQEYSAIEGDAVITDDEALSVIIRETAAELAGRIADPETKDDFLLGRYVDVKPEAIVNMPIEFRS